MLKIASYKKNTQELDLFVNVRWKVVSKITLKLNQLSKVLRQKSLLCLKVLLSRRTYHSISPYRICFLTPPAFPEVPEFNVRQTYSLSSLAFKRVTCGSAITKHNSPPPCYPRYMKVQLGAWSTPNISRQHLPQSKYIKFHLCSHPSVLMKLKLI